ncbi:isoprenyl transferase [Candidatus Omnitrophota bacterium]
MPKKKNTPKHIAIIMDGNGRWAKIRGLPRTVGHKEGIKRLEEIVDAAGGLGLEVITFFAFSTENWSRPKHEVGMLMRSLNSFLKKRLKELNKSNIRLKIIGGGDPLPGYLQDELKRAQEATRGNTGLTVCLALNYGSRQEIANAAKEFARAVLEGKADVDGLTPESFGRYFYTSGLPDPDLLIRTSGEQRISNFLLWQISYSELYFPKKHWPDFRKMDLEEAIKVYQNRERRYGGL